MIGTGAMSDPYIPLEMELGMTQRALEVIEKYGFGVAIQTKSDAILRDLELLSRIHHKTKAVVQMTLTTSDDDLCRILEPNVCVTSRRIDVLKRFRDAGIPTVVWLCPILPFLNDTPENILGILDACSEAGVRYVLGSVIVVCFWWFVLSGRCCPTQYTSVPTAVSPSTARAKLPGTSILNTIIGIRFSLHIAVAVRSITRSPRV